MGFAGCSIRFLRCLALVLSRSAWTCLVRPSPLSTGRAGAGHRSCTVDQQQRAHHARPGRRRRLRRPGVPRWCPTQQPRRGVTCCAVLCSGGGEEGPAAWGVGLGMLGGRPVCPTSVQRQQPGHNVGFDSTGVVVLGALWLSGLCVVAVAAACGGCSQRGLTAVAVSAHCVWCVRGRAESAILKAGPAGCACYHTALLR